MNSIVVFIPSLQGGGAERAAIQFANRLSCKNRVYLVAVKSIDEFPGLIDSSVIKININAKKTVLSLPYLAYFILKTRPSCVFSLLVSSNIISILVKILLAYFGCQFKLVISERNVYSRRHYPRLHGFLVSLLYHRADEIAVVSEAVKFSLINNVNSLSNKNIFVLPNYVRPFNVCRVGYQPEIPIKILNVGRIEKHKNHMDFVRLIGDLLINGYDVTGIIAGKGDYEFQLKKYIAHKNLQENISFVGFSDNIHEYYVMSDILVHSSRREGASGVILEALSLKLPVIAYSASGCNDEILNNSMCSVIVKDDYQCLYLAVSEFIDKYLKVEESKLPKQSCLPPAYSYEYIDSVLFKHIS